MTSNGQDVHQTLEYRTTAEVVRLLPTGLLMIFLSLFIYILADSSAKPGAGWIYCGLALVIGVGLAGASLWRRSRVGAALFTLSTAGIRSRIPFVKTILVPWHEIQGVDTIDFSVAHWWPFWLISGSPTYPRMVNCRDVTVVLVSKPFYEQHIHVRSYFLRGPGWKANFIPKGEMMQMALHHQIVAVEPQALRQAVEARWRAFRDHPAHAPANVTVPRVPAPKAVAMGDNARALSAWEKTKIVVPLIGIIAGLTNIAGAWQWAGQKQDRERAHAVRAKVLADKRYWDDHRKRQREETKERDAERKERDRMMQRTFGR